MAEDTSSFRATLYLEGSSGKHEVRRFVLPKNALTDFLFLEEKLKTVFQSLQSLPFSVMWEDSEGEVLISSDEELKVAIKEMKGDVYRLKIEAKSASGLKDENAEARMAEEAYSFRATLYLEGSSGKHEVRRFILPKNASTDFLFLEKKLKTVFQSLHSLPFSVIWEDSEGEVLISSDEELKIALNKMKGEDYRLKIEVKSASGLKDENAEGRMADETSSFKVTSYLEGSSGKNEIRRFVLSKNALTDFLFLEEKLKTLFQSLQSLPFSVAWEDSEGDEVLISSDEELKVALKEMKGEVYRLKIEVKSASGLKDENAEVHPRVHCDGCGGEVKGFGYKNTEGAAAPPQNESEWKDVDKTSQDKDDSRSKYLKTIGETVSTSLDALDDKTEEDVPPQPLRFHERTGENIDLSNGKRTAARRDYEEIPYGGSVITNRPLKDDELFEVRLDTIIDKWINGFSLGVTVANPTTVSFKDHWIYFKDGFWLYLGDSISHNGNDIQSEYGINLGTLKVGDRVGVMRKSNGSLHFFVNGTDQGAIPTTVPETVYGVMDLYANAVRATIVKP